MRKRRRRKGQVWKKKRGENYIKTRIENKLPYKDKEKNLANLYLINLEGFLNEKEERASLEKKEG